MTYDEQEDCYICYDNRKLVVVKERIRHNKNGYASTETIYECLTCDGCPCKEQCIHGNNWSIPMEQRTKRVWVSKVMKEKRRKALERIRTKYSWEYIAGQYEQLFLSNLKDAED